MDNESLIYLDNIKTSFYEKGIDLINVHIYVRDVEDNEILFEENKVICKFSTKHPRFIKQYADGGRGKHTFCYIINTREAIDCSGCYYTVRGPFIEVILKKKVPQKWKGLQNLEMSALLGDMNLDVKKTKQLLGGKSTPMKTNDEKKPEVDVKIENIASSSKTEDERNIKKAVASQPEHLAGLTGLENYANNCYMNVVIQILANIQETRDYFKNDYYLKDVNANNPLSSGGKVVKAFADVTKALWSFRKNAFKPAALKNIMGKRYSLFLGWQQHDAQEFFASLLDNLHEDLNQSHYEKGAEKESNKIEVDSTVNEKPDTAWAAHLKRNNSFIVKLFHGQLMSKLTCAACHKVSYSYDPCAQISLPILTTKHHLRILFFTLDVNKPPLMVSMQISTPNAKVWHLINMLQAVVKVPSHLISLFNGIHNVCVDEQAPLLSVRKYKYVVASEVSSKDEVEFISIPVFQYVLHSGQFVHCDNCFTLQSGSTKLKRCTRCLAVAYCTRECQTKHWHVHSKTCIKDLKMQVGVPFYVTLRKDSLLTYETLDESLRDRAKFSVELFSTLCAEENSSIDNSSDETTECVKQTQRLPLASSAVCLIKVSNKPSNDDSCVTINSDNFSPDIIFKASYLVVEWQNTPEEGDISSNIRTKSVPIHEVYKSDSNTGITEEEDQCSLYDCLRLFMEPESLDKRDSWKCPKCKSLQSAKKEMAISSPPGLLLLHLKRFTYGDFGQKINKAVSYPLSNFDLSPFIAKETRSKIEHHLIYDLCGVITHSGSMRMGHYTCIVRMLGMHDQEEIGWRFFDDDSVIKIKSDKVISPDAYVLVYRLQGAQEILKLGSMHSENLVKIKCTDAVAGATGPNVEKVSKPNRLSGTEFDWDSIKRSSSLDINYETLCEPYNSSPLHHAEVENNDTLSEFCLSQPNDVLNSISADSPDVDTAVIDVNMFSSTMECSVDHSDIADIKVNPASFPVATGNQNFIHKATTDTKEDVYSYSSVMEDGEPDISKATDVELDSNLFSSTIDLNPNDNEGSTIINILSSHSTMVESVDCGPGMTVVEAMMDSTFVSPSKDLHNNSEATTEGISVDISRESILELVQFNISHNLKSGVKDTQWIDATQVFDAEDQYFHSTRESENSVNCMFTVESSESWNVHSYTKDISNINEDDLD